MIVGLLFAIALAPWPSFAVPPATFPAASQPAATVSANPAALVAGLAASDPAERERSARDLMALGSAGRAAILDAIESDDPQLRLSAADLILRLGFEQPEDPPAVAGFLKVYGKPAVPARITYLPAISSAAGAAAPRVLMRLVREDPSDEVRWAIVSMIRTMDRKALPGPEAFDRSSPHSPNRALAAWAWETRDYPTAVQIYRQWLEVETHHPTRDNGAAGFAFDALLDVARWDRDYDRAADVYRAQFVRGAMAYDGQFQPGLDKLDDLFALHAMFGPLRGFVTDLAAAKDRLSRPQVVYALGRLYQQRMGQNLLADALYRAAYATGMGSIIVRDEAGVFLFKHQWDGLAEGEFAAALAINPDRQSIFSANANLRMGALLARRGDDLGAAHCKERAMESLRDEGRTLTRVRGNRTYTDAEVRSQLWAEIHWHYFRVARAAGDRAEMDKRLAAIMPLAPDDQQIALDTIPDLLERGRKRDAAELFAKPYAALRASVDEKPDDPERLNNLAWLCARSSQRLDEAQTLIGAALKTQPDNYAYLDTAAEIQFQLGHADRAVELETRANQLNPGNDFLQSQLKRFQSKSSSGQNP
jgi:tetratricopeptide (TPR) repeat protein